MMECLMDCLGGQKLSPFVVSEVVNTAIIPDLQTQTVHCDHFTSFRQ